MTSSSVRTLNHGKYTLQQLLGQGSLYVAYRASVADSNKPVVIMGLNQTLRQHPEFAQIQKAFIAEARRAATCPHPHLIRLVELFGEAGHVYLVVDYVLGQSLNQLVQTDGPLPEPQALRYACQVASALSTLHQKGIIHRNFTPHSLVRRKDSDMLVLTDLGIGREFLASRPLVPGMLLVGYSSPESYTQDTPHSPATDIYSLSATFYYLVTGQIPTPPPLRDRIPLVPPRHFQPSLSSGIEQAILQGMAMHQHQRPQSVQAWLALATATSANAPAISPVRPAPKTPIPAPSPNPSPAPQTSPALASSLPPHPEEGVAQFATQAESRPTPTVAVLSPARIAPSASPALSPAKRQRTLQSWLIIVAIVSVTIGVGLGLAARFWLLSRTGTPNLKLEQTFPQRNWPNF